MAAAVAHYLTRLDFYHRYLIHDYDCAVSSARSLCILNANITESCSINSTYKSTGYNVTHASLFKFILYIIINN